MRALALITAAAAAAVAAATADATATPVGPLPVGPKATVVTNVGELVAVALPHRSGGRAWRIARPFDVTIVHEVSEADVGANVVVLFRATRPGVTTLSFALTRGETAKALEARRVGVFVVAN
jgi:hypothetical protein